MVNVSSQVHTVEGVVAALRTRNASKTAALGTLAYATKASAALQRAGEYIEAIAHAHETGNVEEAQGLAIALSRAAITFSQATTQLDNAIAQELQLTRAVG